MGQHFLTGAGTISRVVGAIAPMAGESFLEVGPGRGALTWPLLAEGVRLLAVELDPRLVAQLQRTAGKEADFRVVEGDILDLEIDSALDCFFSPGGKVRVVGNLPYSVATPATLRLLALGSHFQDLTLMVQREVAARILSPPGGRDYGALSLLCAYHARVRPLLNLSPRSFSPPPEVHSTLLRFEPIPPEPSCDFEAFAHTVKAAFAGRRKTLRNSLALGLGCSTCVVEPLILAAGLDPSARPQTLDRAQFLDLTRGCRSLER